jgi:hypothetical protein
MFIHDEIPEAKKGIPQDGENALQAGPAGD